MLMMVIPVQYTTKRRQRKKLTATFLDPLACRLTWTMVSRFCRDVDAVLMTDAGPMVTTVT